MYEPLYPQPPVTGEIVLLLFFYNDGFGIILPTKVDMRLNKLVKLATIVEGDPKAPFSIATTPRCRGGR